MQLNRPNKTVVSHTSFNKTFILSSYLGSLYIVVDDTFFPFLFTHLLPKLSTMFVGNLLPDELLSLSFNTMLFYNYLAKLQVL